MKDLEPLGWKEWIAFPELNIPKIKAKIDTGARSSALHAFRVEPFERDCAPWVRFAIHPVQGDTAIVVDCEAPVIDRRIVRDSGGHDELRYVINALIAIGDHRIQSEVTLTDRDTMMFRVLLGRTALRSRFVIHPAKSYLQGKPAHKKIKKELRMK
ncbi:MAG TPA: ATP-dependent zinc protease [Halioglobus sp.]